MKRDGIIGVVAILIAVFFCYQTTFVYVPENLAEPGPRIIPYLAQILMIICGSGMIFESVKKDKIKPFLTINGWKRLGIIYGVLFLYAIGLTYLGFLLVTPIMSFVIITMLSQEIKIKTVKKIIVSLLLTIGLYLVFTKGFGVMLPQGMF